MRTIDYVGLNSKELKWLDENSQKVLVEIYKDKILVKSYYENFMEKDGGVYYIEHDGDTNRYPLPRYKLKNGEYAYEKSYSFPWVNRSVAFTYLVNEAGIEMTKLHWTNKEMSNYLDLGERTE